MDNRFHVTCWPKNILEILSKVCSPRMHQWCTMGLHIASCCCSGFLWQTDFWLMISFYGCFVSSTVTKSAVTIEAIIVIIICISFFFHFILFFCIVFCAVHFNEKERNFLVDRRLDSVPARAPKLQNALSWLTTMSCLSPVCVLWVYSR